MSTRQVFTVIITGFGNAVKNIKKRVALTSFVRYKSLRSFSPFFHLPLLVFVWNDFTDGL